MAREIALAGGGVAALVDDEDYDRVAAHPWHAHPPNGRTQRWYAARKHEGRTVYLHRFVTAAPAGVEVDHANGNGLDCRRSNLRIATRGQNEANKAKRSGTTSSRYKGVYFDKRRGAWHARIGLAGRHVHLGYFRDEAAAADAYDRAAREHFRGLRRAEP